MVDTTTRDRRNGVQRPLLQSAKDDRAEFMWMDAELATRFLAEYQWPGQRAPRRGHTSFLVREMEHDRWQRGAVIHLGQLLDGSTFLLDGQHRLAAIIEADQRRPGFDARMLVATYQCRDMEEIRDIYATMDQQRGRSPKERLTALDIPEKAGLAPYDVAAIQAAAGLVLGGFTGRDSNQDERSGLVRGDFVMEWQEEARLYVACLAGAKKHIGKWLRRSPVVGVALLTLRDQRDLAVEYWTAVAANNGLAADCPEAKLLEYLATNTVNEKKGTWRYARYVATCWNAYFNGYATLTRLTVKAWDQPILIEGTRDYSQTSRERDRDRRTRLTRER